MRRSVLAATAVVLASGIALAAQSDDAADLPYAGKWKLNVAKSDFGEQTMTFGETTSGEMQFAAMGQSYTFRVDGKDYPALVGLTAAWKQIDAVTWETVWKKDGKPLSIDMTRLSPDGNTLTLTSKGLEEAGAAWDDKIVHERVSGGPGLAGTWKTKNVESNVPTVLELVPSGNDGLVLHYSASGGRTEAKFDGKDYPVVGPAVPAGMTLAIRKTGPRSFDMTQKHNGKPLVNVSLIVSSDGKTLTSTGGLVGVDEKAKAVYDRQ